ncbi:MAG: 3-hydroxyacyl-CoA dehydrogenase NAD-binding domain-containing protein [Pseudomonadota bacterium]
MTIAAVIGLGTMGPGIAATLARGGMKIRVYDTSAEALEKAPGMVAMAFGVLDRLDMPDKGSADDISYHTDLAEAVDGVDLVVETVPEKLEIKAAVFAELDKHVSKDCVLASNTSGIPITKLQEGISNPGRVIGMHWSNPPMIIPMIEVIAGGQTDQGTVDWMCDTIRGLNLLPVVVKKDVAGFVENRILYAIMRESVDLVEQGVIDAEGLDTCVQWGIGYKLAIIGPMALLDMAGLDIYQAVGSYLNAELCNRPDVSPYITDRTKDGNLGQKTGSGIFSYTPDDVQRLRGERAAAFVAVRKALEGKS